jgi:hypothetical protein
MKRLGLSALALLLAAVVWYAVAHHHSAVAGKLPRTLEEFKQRPGGGPTVDAGDFLIGLAKRGKLPGFSADEHGTMHAAVMDANGHTLH